MYGNACQIVIAAWIYMKAFTTHSLRLKKRRGFSGCTCITNLISRDVCIRAQSVKGCLTAKLSGNASRDIKLKPFLVYHSGTPQVTKGLPVTQKLNQKIWETQTSFNNNLFLYFVPQWGDTMKILWWHQTQRLVPSWQCQRVLGELKFTLYYTTYVPPDRHHVSPPAHGPMHHSYLQVKPQLHLQLAGQGEWWVTAVH